MFLTIPEAAEEARMSETFIKKEIREGRLIARKTGRHTRIRREEMELWAQRLPVKIVGTSTGLDGSPTKSTANQVIENTVSAR